jgi:hypothetical protein
MCTPARRPIRGAALSRVCSSAGNAHPRVSVDVVEQSRCDALSQEPELVNPRAGSGELRVPFLDSDIVDGSGDG